MATYTSRKRTVRHIEYLVPVPAAYAEIARAIVAAERHLRRARHLDQAVDLSDDALWVTVEDGLMVISFTLDADLPTAA